ncbi:MAG: flagellar biosynthetic protein FliQ [Brockia lithotrophica]|nr:flagellar biosynthetic protein FliQ [Brockia lithotrophica]
MCVTPETVQYVFREVLGTLFLLLTPILGAGLVVGVLFGILQAATQIQEQTLVFVPKLFAMFLVIGLLGKWMLGVLVELTYRLLALAGNLGG